jgi:hypothetical protein
LIGAPGLTPAAQADPTFQVMNAAGGIYWRSGPDWNTAEAIPGFGFYNGTTIAIHCYQSGAGDVPGSADTMWEQATDVAGPGYGSGWINEHFINDGQPINQPSPGVGPCIAPPPPPPPVLSPHVGCYGDYCSGKDPEATGCATGARTLAVTNLTYGTLSLRWSATCKTEWARLYVYPTRTLGPGYVIAQQSTGYYQTGPIYAIASWTPHSETTWSPMIYSPVLCVKAGANLGTGYIWNTDWTTCI